MTVKQINETPKTFILVFETGDELAEGLAAFAKGQQLAAASFKAIGGLSSVRLTWFSWETNGPESSSVTSNSLSGLWSSR